MSKAPTPINWADIACSFAILGAGISESFLAFHSNIITALAVHSKYLDQKALARGRQEQFAEEAGLAIERIGRES